MTHPSVLELGEENVVSYLEERGAIPPRARATSDALGWGISNFVARVDWDGGCLVLKQSLPKLRVEEDWPFDRNRIAVEERCMRYLGRLLPAGAVPEVVFSDLDNYTFAMSCAPPGGTLWKEALLEGRVDSVAAERAGALLGLVHARSADDPSARDAFAGRAGLLEGRIDPYHLTTAARNPDLADLIHAEVDRLLSTQQTLVLGDYCPKNTFLYPERVLILDFEVAHWGDPGFDVAFCINHLVLKACRFRDRSSAYLEAARAFWRAYADAAGDRFAGVESSAVRELGCLLLARIDGKSKIEYISDEPTKALVRRLARDILTADPRSIDETLAAVQLDLRRTGLAKL